MTGNYFLSFCCVFYSSLEYLKKEFNIKKYTRGGKLDKRKKTGLFLMKL